MPAPIRAKGILRLGLYVGFCVLLEVSHASANPVTWQLNNVTFDAGLGQIGIPGPIVATGTLVYDADLQQFLTWDITVSGATDPTLNFNFTPSSSFIPSIYLTNKTTEVEFVRTMPGNPAENAFGDSPFDSNSVAIEFDFFESNFNAGLTDAGGTIPITTGATFLYQIATSTQFGVRTGSVVSTPATNGGFTETGSMAFARIDHTATLLNNGQVLITSGYDNNTLAYLTSAELYHPQRGTFTATGSMITGRQGPAATLLNNGKVLITGGFGYDGPAAIAELYDPNTGTFSATGAMLTPRYGHTATVLPDGKVLIAGGHSLTTVLASAELYDPKTGLFSATGSMALTREAHTATLLKNGEVLVAGGGTLSSPNVSSNAELYDPHSGTFKSTGAMSSGRVWHTATLMNDGKVLIAGGANVSGHMLSSAEVYDPQAGIFRNVYPMSGKRANFTAALLSDGRVLVAGGTYFDANYNYALSTAEIYDPNTHQFSATGSMTIPRYGPKSVALKTGKVIVMGGSNRNAQSLATADLFDASTH